MVKRWNLLKVSWWTMLLVMILVIISALSYLSLSPAVDLIYASISRNGPVMVSQSLLLCLIYWQVASFRKIRPLVVVRQQEAVIEKHLFFLAVFETVLYFTAFDGAFLLTGNVVFRDGPVLLGLLLLVLRAAVVFFLAMVLLTTYKIAYPGLTLLMVLLANFFYHYVIEAHFLLIQYSVKYDPLWQIFHQQ